MNINHGWLENISHIKSPNFDCRPEGVNISLIVIHNISLPPAEFGGDDICLFFCNKLDSSKHKFYKDIENLKVSSHILIKRDGEIIQFVSFIDRAWHAGKSIYKNITNCNNFSIGIELEGCDNINYTDEQYSALTNLTVTLQNNYPMIKDNITGHSNIAPNRKTDPGESFDWDRYNKAIKLKNIL